MVCHSYHPNRKNKYLSQIFSTSVFLWLMHVRSCGNKISRTCLQELYCHESSYTLLRDHDARELFVEIVQFTELHRSDCSIPLECPQTFIYNIYISICLHMHVLLIYLYIVFYSILCLQVAILVPFRNRHEHLPILLRHLVPVLQKQRVQFAFYVIEQVCTHVFTVICRNEQIHL